jgi:hypothetical protein
VVEMWASEESIISERNNAAKNNTTENKAR